MHFREMKQLYCKEVCVSSSVLQRALGDRVRVTGTLTSGMPCLVVIQLCNCGISWAQIYFICGSDFFFSASSEPFCSLGSCLSTGSLKDSIVKWLEALLLKEASLNCTGFYVFIIWLVTWQEEGHSVPLYNEELTLVTIYYKKVIIYCKKFYVALNRLFLQLSFLC